MRASWDLFAGEQYAVGPLSFRLYKRIGIPPAHIKSFEL